MNCLLSVDACLIEILLLRRVGLYFQIESSVEVASPVIERTESMRPERQCLVEEEYTVGVPLVSINPLMMNGFIHLYQLDESTFIFFMGVNFLYANSIAPDGRLHSMASHLELYCLPMFHKKDARLNYK